MSLPHRFTWKGEAWVVVESPAPDHAKRQCAVCQRSKLRPLGFGRGWCNEFVKAASAPYKPLLACGPSNVIYIRDTEEGWAQHALNVLVGDS